MYPPQNFKCSTKFCYGVCNPVPTYPNIRIFRTQFLADIFHFQFNTLVDGRSCFVAVFTFANWKKICKGPVNELLKFILLSSRTEIRIVLTNNQRTMLYRYFLISLFFTKCRCTGRHINYKSFMLSITPCSSAILVKTLFKSMRLIGPAKSA